MNLVLLAVALVVVGILVLAILAGDSDRESLPRHDPHPKQLGER